MHLTPNQIQVIDECLRAAAYGPFFPDGEFSALFGMTRKQVADVAEQWPVVLSEPEHVHLAVNNSMNNLLGYPSKQRAEWGDYVSVDRDEVKSVLAVWRQQRT